MTWPISTGIARGLSSSIAVHAAGGAALLDGTESDGTNVVTGTDAMTSGWWTLFSTLTNAAAVAPSGATVASSVKEDATASERHRVFQIVSNVTGSVTASVYAKASTRRYLQMMVAHTASSNLAYVYADLQTGTITDSAAEASGSLGTTSIAAAVNGFYKITMGCTVSAGLHDVYFLIALSDRGTQLGGTVITSTPAYNGDNTSLLYLWRPKLVD